MKQNLDKVGIFTQTLNLLNERYRYHQNIRGQDEQQCNIPLPGTDQVLELLSETHSRSGPLCMDSHIR